MKIVKIIIQVALVLVFLMAGATKVMKPQEELKTQPMMEWVEDFTPNQVKIIGALEVLGALGLILPILLKRNKRLVPLAALGLMAVMVGAVVTRVGRGEDMYFDLALLVLLGLSFYWHRNMLKTG